MDKTKKTNAITEQMVHLIIVLHSQIPAHKTKSTAAEKTRNGDIAIRY
jgi:hypothetical protein